MRTVDYRDRFRLTRRAQKMRRIWRGRNLRFAVVAIATMATGAALASAGLAGLNAVDFGSAAAKQYPVKKVTVCHHTHSKKHPWVKITISRNALKAHRRHGDFLVDANNPCPPNTASATKKNKNKGKSNGKGKNKGKAQKQQGKGQGGKQGKK
jgi:hypothetical protein